MTLPQVDPVKRSGGSWIGPKRVALTELRKGDVEYLVRYIIFRTPWGGLQVHHIKRPDADRHLHDHPRVFWSFILRGGYREETRSGWNTWRPGSIHRMDLNIFHSIRYVPTGGAWTFLVVGPERQSWGFLTEDGLIDWTEYPDYIRQKEPHV